MDLKENLTKSNIFIFVCAIIILGLFLFIINNLIELYANATLTSDTKLMSSSTCASLIVALISIISIVINNNLTRKSIEQTNENIEENRMHNQKTINQTNQLIEQNEENRYIELRFQNVQKALFKLSNELQIALKIQYELKKLNSEKLLFDSRGFLLMQYINLIENNNLLNYIPLKLRVDFDSHFNKRICKDISDQSEEYMCEINSYNGCNYSVLVLEELTFFLEFENIVEKFNKNCSSGYFKNEFKRYYSSDISEEELENHFRDIILEIDVNKPEKHILDEKELIVLS